MAVSREQLLAKLKKMTRKDLSQISDQTPLFSDGLIDSFALIDLMTWLGKKLGTRLTADDGNLDNFDTIERILAFVAKRSS